MKGGGGIFNLVKNEFSGAAHGKCWTVVRFGAKHGIAYKIFLALPFILFLSFLTFRLHKNFKRILHTKSYVMSTYYTFIWIITFLNIIWLLLQVRQATDGGKFFWNVMTLIVNFGIVLLEISILVFLSQGYLVGGRDALIRALVFSTFAASVDTLLKATFMFGLGVPLYLVGDDTGNWKKWIFWFSRNLLFAGVYLFIVIIPHTKLRDKFPARPSFYRYAAVLFMFNILAAFGSALIVFEADFGYCLHGFAPFVYFALYPPLLYATFMADFFLEDDLQFDDVFYAEMKDPGYFDAWD